MTDFVNRYQYAVQVAAATYDAALAAFQEFEPGANSSAALIAQERGQCAESALRDAVRELCDYERGLR